MEVNRIPVYLDFIVEHLDSKLVPWSFIEDDSYAINEKDKEYPLHEDLSLFETDIWPVPVENPQIGKRYHIQGQAEIVYTKDWTECGEEYDAHIEWDVIKAEEIKE